MLLRFYYEPDRLPVSIAADLPAILVGIAVPAQEIGNELFEPARCGPLIFVGSRPFRGAGI
jgi:hypothetical protein